MGKKRRVLKNPKFSSLRKLRKFQELVSGSEETTASSVAEELPPTPTLEVAKKDVTPKLGSKLETKTPPTRRAKKATVKKPRTRRAPRKKSST